MITPNDLKKIEIENIDFNKIETEIDECIKKLMVHILGKRL